MGFLMFHAIQLASLCTSWDGILDVSSSSWGSWYPLAGYFQMGSWCFLRGMWLAVFILDVNGLVVFLLPADELAVFILLKVAILTSYLGGILSVSLLQGHFANFFLITLRNNFFPFFWAGAWVSIQAPAFIPCLQSQLKRGKEKE